MKKIIFGIITTFFIFSTQTFAQEKWLIEKMLNLNYWPMVYDLSLEKLDNYTYKDYYLNNLYNNLVKYDKIIKDNIIKYYKDWKYDYNTTNWIIRNYKNFISYTNDFFYFSKMMEKYPYLKNDIEIQDGFLKSYKNSQIYYKKVQNLISKRIAKK